MVTRAIAVLQESGIYAFAFENVADAQALTAVADESYYGAKYSVFIGNVAEFIAHYELESEEHEYSDTSVKAITHEIAQQYLTNEQTIWDIAQDAEEENEENVVDAWIVIGD
jgi:hypothetical protein